MTVKTIPSLSGDGWIDVNKEPVLAGNIIFSHFFCSDYSQSYFYIGEVLSYSHILQENNNDMDETQNKLRDNLEKYFKRYYYETSVVVHQMKENSRGLIDLSIYVDFTTIDGVKNTLSKAIQLENGTAIKIIDENNGV